MSEGPVVASGTLIPAVAVSKVVAACAATDACMGEGAGGLSLGGNSTSTGGCAGLAGALHTGGYASNGEARFCLWIDPNPV